MEVLKGQRYTQKASDQLDWFKFETRIRRIIMELTEPSIKRCRDMDAENRNIHRSQDTLNQRLEEFDFNLEKLVQKTNAQDELLLTIRQVEQYTKLTEQKVLNEMSIMNGNLELVKEKMRAD